MQQFSKMFKSPQFRSPKISVISRIQFGGNELMRKLKLFGEFFQISRDIIFNKTAQIDGRGINSGEGS